MKKIIYFAVTLLLLSACVGQAKRISPHQKIEAIGREYVTQLRHFVPREKNRENNEDNPAFSAFLETILKRDVATDYLQQHYFLANAKTAGVKKAEVTLGSFSYVDDWQGVADMEEDLAKLRSFPFSSLSFRQQIDYEALEYSYLESLASKGFAHYDLLFYETGLLANLTTDFREFVFRDATSIQDYLTLLQDVKRYLQEALYYTKQQAAEGIALADVALDETQRFIRDFVKQQETNSLIVSFAQKLANIDFIDAQEKEHYLQVNRDVVLQQVLPAYQQVATELEKYRGQSRLKAQQAGLAGYAKEYGQFLLMQQASNNFSLDESFDILLDMLQEYSDRVFALAEDDPSFQEYQDVYDHPEKFPVLNLTARKTLDYLQKQITERYPKTTPFTYEIWELDPLSTPASVMAYFLRGPIDSKEDNIIRLNPRALKEDPFTTYITLAHEGFPGHMYQHAYFCQQQNVPIRHLLSFVGYAEGQAMYAELNALSWLGLAEKNTEILLAYDTIFNYGIQALIDIGVNAYGWNQQKVANFLGEFGLQEEASNLYAAVVADPLGIIPYGLGLAQFLRLHEGTRLAQVDFDDHIFHRIMLQHGPLPFVILADELQHYHDYAK